MLFRKIFFQIFGLNQESRSYIKDLRCYLINLLIFFREEEPKQPEYHFAMKFLIDVANIILKG